MSLSSKNTPNTKFCNLVQNYKKIFSLKDLKKKKDKKDHFLETQYTKATSPRMESLETYQSPYSLSNKLKTSQSPRSFSQRSRMQKSNQKFTIRKTKLSSRPKDVSEKNKAYFSKLGESSTRRTQNERITYTSRLAVEHPEAFKYLNFHASDPMIENFKQKSKLEDLLKKLSKLRENKKNKKKFLQVKSFDKNHKRHRFRLKLHKSLAKILKNTKDKMGDDRTNLKSAYKFKEKNLYNKNLLKLHKIAKNHIGNATNSRLNTKSTKNNDYMNDFIKKYSETKKIVNKNIANKEIVNLNKKTVKTILKLGKKLKLYFGMDEEEISTFTRRNGMHIGNKFKLLSDEYNEILENQESMF